MLLAATILLPALAGFITLLPIGRRAAVGVMLVTAVAQLTAVVSFWISLPPGWAPLFHLDALGLLFLSLTSGLFTIGAVYSAAWLARESVEDPSCYRRYVPFLLWLLTAAGWVAATEHLAVVWAAIEATTLASAPLIYFHKRRSALEATWKFLLICSVGIALALLGTFFLGISATKVAPVPELTVTALSRVAGALDPQWLKVAFVLALVGYGTKMGLAPLHTWLPDTYAQAPAPVSALMSGTLINCALLGVLRFFQVCVAAGPGMAGPARQMLLALGFVSLAVAAAFILKQRDFKRLFAYSSVENMGIIALGIGSGATTGAMLHVVNHSMVKSALFFVAGNLVAAYGTTECAQVRGIVRRLPVTGVLAVVATLAIGGSPPFGLFLSELTIFRGLLDRSVGYGAVFAALLAIAFLGLCGTVLPMAQDVDEGAAHPRLSEHWRTWAPPLLLMLLALALGVVLPSVLGERLEAAAAFLGGRHGG